MGKRNRWCQNTTKALITGHDCRRLSAFELRSPHFMRYHRAQSPGLQRLPQGANVIEMLFRLGFALLLSLGLALLLAWGWSSSDTRAQEAADQRVATNSSLAPLP